MFRFEYPVFEHKSLLKKSMLDELRDYPLNLSKMYFSKWGNGILEGCELNWNQDILNIQPGLIHYEENVYRMEKPYIISCQATDRLSYLKVRFGESYYERGCMGRVGEIILDENPLRNGEMELGRFRLQEGARLRTIYENFEDYQTEYDTVNRIYVPYAQIGDSGLWPQMLKVFAMELLETGTTDIQDISFAMTLFGVDGYISSECVKWYVCRTENLRVNEMSNRDIYDALLSVLKKRKAGGKGMLDKESGMRQMILL